MGRMRAPAQESINRLTNPWAVVVYHVTHHDVCIPMNYVERDLFLHVILFQGRVKGSTALENECRATLENVGKQSPDAPLRSWDFQGTPWRP